MTAAKIHTVTLLEELRQLEVELHRSEIRRDRSRVEALLHPDFLEFGRSGARYVRDDILRLFGAGPALPDIHSEGYDLVVLAEDVALLTYSSADRDPEGNLQGNALRSSLWVRTETGWKMRFHQGTPAAAEIPNPQ